MPLQNRGVPLAYLPMRLLALTLIFVTATMPFGFTQTIDVKPKASATPAKPVVASAQDLYRPALLGSGPNALINRIDSNDLMAKGQKDALIMFTCTVRTTGEVVWSATYRGTPDSKALEDELRKELLTAKFIPAIYNKVPVDAIFYGTATFSVVDGRPRLRIFANQEPEELKKESDFIGPQPFFGRESQFTGWHYPSKQDSPLEINGAVELLLSVTDKGFPNKMSVVSEEPPFVGFADAAMYDLGKARFIPAFRDGKPVACTVHLPVYFKHRDEVFNARIINE